jgi:hypothetical protein
MIAVRLTSRVLRTAATALILVLASVDLVSAQQATVEFEPVTVAPGDHSYFRIVLDNSVPVAAARIPLLLPSVDLTIDSVSFRYTVAPDFNLYSRFNNNDRRNFILFLPNLNYIPTVDPPGGELCRVYFTVDRYAPAGSIPIDTFTNRQYVGEIEIVDRLELSDDLGNVILPDFHAGEIIVQSSGDIDTTSDQGQNPTETLPTSFALRQNYPNPFNPTTRIIFSLPYSSEISLIVYDDVGRQIEVLGKGTYPPGRQSVEWDATDRPSGIYFYRLKTPQGTLSRKMVVIK